MIAVLIRRVGSSAQRDDHVRQQEGSHLCKPRKEALEETSCAGVLILHAWPPEINV